MKRLKAKMTQISLVKGDHRFIFRYAVGQEEREAREAIIEAARKQLITWSDARILDDQLIRRAKGSVKLFHRLLLAAIILSGGALVVILMAEDFGCLHSIELS